MYFLHTIYITDYQIYNYLKIGYKINFNTLSSFILNLKAGFHCLRKPAIFYPPDDELIT
jgi:hypothetical protein